MLFLRRFDLFNKNCSRDLKHDCVQAVSSTWCMRGNWVIRLWSDFPQHAASPDRFTPSMVYICRKIGCRHVQDDECIWSEGKYHCCKCQTDMYESRVHTPASNCSMGSGKASLGSSVFFDGTGADEFTTALKAKLEAYQDDDPQTADGEEMQASRKVLEWKERLADLLGGNADESPTAGSVRGDEDGVDDDAPVGDLVREDEDYRQSQEIGDKLEGVAMGAYCDDESCRKSDLEGRPCVSQIVSSAKRRLTQSSDECTKRKIVRR
ncbi:hypothetical protein B0T24DRAFT_17424 [Lasiosphaeria ovina]|uniref:Uncharacterized protein n=1 Tax=Lasiosphaeria ovina TaxID=92902 RepID=A0AAE0NJ73_9PEZI|nr:hypothetical protein B0T24DRAFT_17424 [Lasiosphaeria ovina]